MGLQWSMCRACMQQRPAYAKQSHCFDRFISPAALLQVVVKKQAHAPDVRHRARDAGQEIVQHFGSILCLPVVRPLEGRHGEQGIGFHKEIHHQQHLASHLGAQAALGRCRGSGGADVGKACHHHR